MNNFVSNKVPFEIFGDLLNKAKANKNIKEPTAMNLATVGKNNMPSSRMVLLKTYDERGFCFFTNLTSRKADQLKKNQHVALCFYWMEFGVQVRIEGKVQEVSKQEADDYFASRRRGSQIGAWASDQSSEIENPDDLRNKLTEIDQRYQDIEVPRPPFWSGFRVVPNRIEFWWEGRFRIHDRHLYEKDVENWKLTKLYP